MYSTTDNDTGDARIADVATLADALSATNEQGSE
jgi:hypothetical protein